MDRKGYLFAAKIGAVYGGLFLSYVVLLHVFLPNNTIGIVPVIGMALLLLPGITVAVLARKTLESMVEGLAAGAISGVVTGLFAFIALMLFPFLSSFDAGGEYASSASGWFLIVLSLGLCSVLVTGASLIVGAIAAGYTTIMLRLLNLMK